MRFHRISAYNFITLLILALSGSELFSAPIPLLKARVNDTAGMFSESVKAEVERLLAKHESRTSNQVVVATVPSLEGENLEEYSIRLAEAWKIGQKGKDNGVILLFSRDDRKLRIEVGYGLEGTLTDLMAGRIIRNNIVPHFKDGRFDDGLRSGVNGVLQVLNGEVKADVPVKTELKSRKGFGYYIKLVFQYFFIAVGIGIAILFLGSFFIFFINLMFFQTGAVGWVTFALTSLMFFLPLMMMPVVSALQYIGCCEVCLIPGISVTAALLIGLKIFFLVTPFGKRIADRFRLDLSAGSGGGSGSGYSYSSSSSSWSSSSSSSYSGGGGSFGGGGASGSW
ncbi:MAG TPA: TPM domain-containing protein [Spirochaetota bacterium]|nr:TPM domain-containing protein [Spirochaetota bacterium]OPZ37820.1 MAG: hypothetical protein BWY96_01484 [Spirochaetes bacterium ADurb.BinA120]HNU92864.1 TPM domain-containing protein [Spirochaetota bacterium]